MKRVSIKTRLFFSLFALILVILGANYMLNNFLLEHYYTIQKEHTLITVFDDLNRYTDEDSYKTEEFISSFQQITDNYNLQITLITPNEEGMMEIIYESRNDRIMRGRIEGYLFGFDEDVNSREVLISNDAYTIQKCKDSYANNEYLESWGMLNNGCFFLIRTPLQTIKDSARISNTFLAYILLFGLLLSVLIIWWISASLTKPIKELMLISQHMANLEFHVKYTACGSDEINKLGENFNHLSEKLEETISQLKTANNELQSDLKEREQLEEMRKDFLSNVTHELKTPIALIQGYAEGLSECIHDDPESREFYCEVIMDEANKMNNMVKQMLSLNQLESGRDLIKIERFDFAEMLRGVLSCAAILAQQKNASIFCEDISLPIYVWGDEFKIEEVVTNYVTNALNHVDYEREIRITLQKMPSKLRLTVFNTGNPIPEEDLDNIWIKFYKVDKARTREYGGSGIGLSIVKAIMEAHHQDFGVKNKEDGVAFWFELDCDDKGEF